MPVLFIFRVLVSPLSLLIVLSSGCAKAKLEPEEAKKRFLAIAKNGCDGDVREMHDVLHATFKKGALVSDYKDILNTAHLKITDPTQLANHARTNRGKPMCSLFGISMMAQMASY